MEKDIVERDATGKFIEGASANPRGRPKGSRNKVTLMKLMAEEAVRSENAEAMVEVARLIVQQALAGHEKSQKLVWDALMSKSSSDDKSQATEKVEIHIGGLQPAVKAINVIDNDEGDTDG